MPTAVVLMKSGNPGRDTTFCQEFIKLKTAQGALAEATFAPNIILTRWPVRPSTTTAVRPDDCAYLVDNYDSARAANLMAGIRLTSGNFNGPGPFLMIIDGGKIAAVDGSRYTDFATFVGQWQTAVTRMQDQVTAARPTGRGLFGFLWSAIKSILSSSFPPVQGVIMIVEGVLQDMVCP